MASDRKHLERVTKIRAATEKKKGELFSSPFLKQPLAFYSRTCISS